MALLRTWWSKMGGLMVACLLAMLVMGPGLDAVICEGDDGPPAATSAPSGPLVVPLAADQTDLGHTGSDVCIHGHCHHGMTFGPVMAEAKAIILTPARPHFHAAASTYVSQSPAGLERPPRA